MELVNSESKMLNTLLVNQPFGAGDCLFEQTGVRRVANGRQIVWPVFKHFVEGFSRAFTDILFLDIDGVAFNSNRQDRYEADIPMLGNCEVLPMRHADTIMKVEYKFCMRSKYDYLQMDYREWKEQAMWQRDEGREDELYRLLRCSAGRYNLINGIFGSYSQLKVPIEVSNGLPNIEMRTIPGYSLMDWGKIMENATEIHMVSSSSFFMLEQLELKDKTPHLYVRRPLEVDFRNIDYLFTKNYVLHL